MPFALMWISDQATPKKIKSEIQCLGGIGIVSQTQVGAWNSIEVERSFTHIVTVSIWLKPEGPVICVKSIDTTLLYQTIILDDPDVVRNEVGRRNSQLFL